MLETALPTGAAAGGLGEGHPGAGEQAGAADKFNPLIAMGAVIGLLLVVLVVVLASRGGSSGSQGVAGKGMSELDGGAAADGTGAQGTAMELAGAMSPVADLLAEAVALIEQDEWELAGEKLVEIDTLTGRDDQASGLDLGPDLSTGVAVLRADLLQAQVDRIAATLESALARGDRGVLDATIGSMTPQEEQALVADGVRAEMLGSVKSATASMARFERALNSSEPETALTVAFELARSQPSVARGMRAQERAALAVERRIQDLISEADFDSAMASARALRQVWPQRRGLRETIGRIERMSSMSERAEGLFDEAELTIAAGEPHIGLRMLEGRRAPPPFRERVTGLRRRLEEDLEKRDRRPPQFVFDETKDVTFEKGAPANILLRVTDDYMVVGVQAQARNAADEVTKIAAVPMGDGIYRVTIPLEFHGDEPFKFWALAVDHSRHSGKLGASNRPIEIRRKRWFRRGRG